MKQAIYEYYGIHAIGIIKLSSKTYRIKAKDNDYVLKLVNDNIVTEICHYLTTIKLDCLITIIANRYNLYVSRFDNQLFYLMPYYQNDIALIKDLKLRYYFEMLVKLHSQTFYSSKVNKSFFDDLQIVIGEQINSRMQYYENLIESCENKVYKSPSEWLFMLNVDKIMISITKSRNFLGSFYQMCEHKESMRFALTYQNFNHNHILLREKKIISIDNMRISSPVYDIFDVYQHLNDIFYDLEELVAIYLRKFTFYDYEKELLCCMLFLLPLIKLTNNEVDNIIAITRLIHYIRSVESMVTTLHSNQSS